MEELFEIPCFCADIFSNFRKQNTEFLSGYYSQCGEDIELHKTTFKENLTSENPGIFVENGALDGITYSNTLFFERIFDWRGVLIEAQPENVKRLFPADRKRTAKIPVAICSLPQTEILMLGEGNALAGDIKSMDESFKKAFYKHSKQIQRVPCAELSVLLTMDWNIHVHSLLIENSSKIPNITDLLQNHGFRIQEFRHCTPGPGCASNTLFVNEKYEKPDFSSICLANISCDI
ncbi:unnamed protein product [Adineta ricciae]|uniref:Uncharacterized protein n=1 Tax=Adineta ricciae TaxID=249248 RepID=A0A816FAN7_ADIRI|nr:unnamed protein product [Adineta ricciae]